MILTYRRNCYHMMLWRVSYTFIGGLWRLIWGFLLGYRRFNLFRGLWVLIQGLLLGWSRSTPLRGL